MKTLAITARVFDKYLKNPFTPLNKKLCPISIKLDNANKDIGKNL